MPLFEFVAERQDGTSQRGTLTAETARNVRDMLRDQGLNVRQVSVRAGETGKSASVVATRSSLFRLPWLQRRAIVAQMIRELSTLLSAGISLVDAIDTLLKQHRGRMHLSLQKLREQLVQGHSMTDAMQQQPDVFDSLCLSMVHVGENSGNLEHVLSILADFSERSMRLQNRLLNAMLYPMIVVVASLGVTIFLMTAVVPQLLESLVQTGKALPWPTVILKATSDGLLQYGWLIALIGAAFVIGVVLAVRTERGRWRRDRFLLQLPVFGNLALRQAISRISFVMATLLKSGVVLVRAMEIAAGTCHNVVIRKALNDVRESIATGRDTGQALEATSVFPPLVVQIFAVGQQSGELDRMLERLAEDYDRQVETVATRLTTLLEPIIILLLTTIVGFIMLAVILPILEAGNGL